jgi:hypothetical protein
MLRSIRKNFFHVVIMCDAASPSARPILKLAESFYVHRAPTKIGLVFQVIFANIVLLEARFEIRRKKFADSSLLAGKMISLEVKCGVAEPEP